MDFPDELLPFLTPGEVAELDQHLASARSVGGAVPRGFAQKLWACARVDAICREAEARKKATEDKLP